MPRGSRLIAIGILLLGALGGGAASAKDRDVQRELQRLWAVSEVQNLMGTYSLWHTSGMNYRVPELFTRTDDTVIEMIWGRYTGKDAAWRCYGVDHRRDDQGAIDALGVKIDPVKPPDPSGMFPPGAEAPAEFTGAATGGGPASMAPLHMHLLTTPIIQVAGDGATARAVWISPGVEGSGWGWMKYGADFRRDNGQWKIWHLHIYGIFMADYQKSWAENPREAPHTTAGQSADKPPTTNWNYYKGATYVPLQPEPPQPYDTWNERIKPASYGQVD